jgi:Putative DNA-binding domain
MLKLEERADLDILVAQDIQESLTLDYKEARSLGKGSSERNELCKDVSAFANSAGGQIVYGIEEKDRHPVRVQEVDGVDSGVITREWIEQVIDSNVQPRIGGLRIKPIEVASGRLAYAITIPAATTNAPHMAPDNKYYYRQNFQSVPMEDYQVRDTMRRATTPELYVRLSLPRGKTAGIEFAYQTEMSKPIILNAFVGNRSAQPAFHTFVQLGIDTDISILPSGDFTPVGERTDADDVPQNWLMRRISTPPEPPIFKEANFDQTRSSVFLGFHSRLLTSVHRFRITTLVQTPGYSASEHWTIFQRGQDLELLEPGHPRAR